MVGSISHNIMHLSIFSLDATSLHECTTSARVLSLIAWFPWITNRWLRMMSTWNVPGPLCTKSKDGVESPTHTTFLLVPLANVFLCAGHEIRDHRCKRSISSVHFHRSSANTLVTTHPGQSFPNIHHPSVDSGTPGQCLIASAEPLYFELVFACARIRSNVGHQI